MISQSKQDQALPKQLKVELEAHKKIYSTMCKLGHTNWTSNPAFCI